MFTNCGLIEKGKCRELARRPCVLQSMQEQAKGGCRLWTYCELWDPMKDPESQNFFGLSSVV